MIGSCDCFSAPVRRLDGGAFELLRNSAVGECNGRLM